MEPVPRKDETPRLRSTLSARNLFAGRDILNQISDFCHELKKLATRAKERENAEKPNQKRSPLGTKKLVVKEVENEGLGLNDREREKKPLVAKQKLRKK